MKIAIYTLTRERIEYTQHCFEVLKQKAGLPYDHFIIDNGSEDLTRQWLAGQKFKRVILLPGNAGISRASNIALRTIYETDDYDIIIKMDNDCEIVTDDILLKMSVLITKSFTEGKNIILSPRVEGIYTQPKRLREDTLNGWIIGITSIIGGLFHVVPTSVYKRYTYPEDLALAQGQDDHFCLWCNRSGYKTGYVEHIQVNHYETTRGQAQRYPEYFKRKYQEEKK